MAAATYAGRVFIFIIIVFKVAYVGIKDTDVLPYAMFTNIMSLLGIIIYREAEPIQPQPEEISATLFTLTKYIKADMYKFGSTSAPQNCGPAYHLNKGFLASQYLVVVVVCMVFSVVITCFVANYRLGKRWTFQVCISLRIIYCSWIASLSQLSELQGCDDCSWIASGFVCLCEQLKGNAIPLVLLVGAFGGYITCFVAKEVVAQLTLDVLRVSAGWQHKRMWSCMISPA
jgi:hypothetical protein